MSNKPMREQATYYQLFPLELHDQVDRVIDYLTHFPFEKPECCVHCGSLSISPCRTTKQQIINYQCRWCKREFNRLTGTLFTRSHFVAQWGQFAQARFSGRTTEEMIVILGISKQSIGYRDKVLLEFLNQHYPDVYAWWKPYHDRVETGIKNPVVGQEVKILHDGLAKLLSTESLICPKCKDRKMRRRSKHRSAFVCDKCQSFSNLLKGTPFNQLSHSEKWLPFLALLVQGDSDTDMRRKLNISLAASRNWRTAFLLVIEDKQLTNLNGWIIWQRNRRTSQAINDSYRKKRLQN